MYEVKYYKYFGRKAILGALLNSTLRANTTKSYVSDKCSFREYLRRLTDCIVKLPLIFSENGDIYRHYYLKPYLQYCT